MFSHSVAGGQGTYPGVIDLYGTTGGLPEYRAAMLASRGLSVLALAYFAYDDLPTSMTLEMEYFEVWIYALNHGIDTYINMKMHLN